MIPDMLLLTLLTFNAMMQVTRKLAALCIQAQQRHADSLTQNVTRHTLHTWLRHAADAQEASPNSSLSASVRQQLQESGLLQHLAAVFSRAADGLDTVTALLAAGDSTVCGNGRSGRSSNSSRHSSSLLSHVIFQSSRAGAALCFARMALRIYSMACSLVAPTRAPHFSPGAALPAAPAAARLALTTIRVCSMPQLQGAQMDAIVAFVINTAHCVMLDFTTFLQGGVEALRQMPGARELLLSPDTMPCLAITVVVGLMRLDTSACLEAVAGNTSGSAAPALNNMSSSSIRSGAGSSAVGGSAQPERLRNGLYLPSLAERVNLSLSTPLASSLFDRLGVDKRRIAALAQPGGQPAWRSSACCMMLIVGC